MEDVQFSFGSVCWGEDDAKADRLLESYFVEYPGFRGILDGGKRYIIGRKGTGKTAILRKIKAVSNENAKIFCESVSLRDFPINELKALGDKKYKDKSKYVPVWKVLLLIELAKLAVQDNSIAGEERDALADFLEKNFSHGEGMAETLTVLSEKKNKIGFFGKMFNAGHAHKESTKEEKAIHSHQAAKIIQKMISSLSSESVFYVLADELDEGFKAGDPNQRLILLALLRACEDLAIEFSETNISFRPIVAMRSDVFETLEDNDLNKLDDYIIRLNWTIAQEGSKSIKRIVEHRIQSSYAEKCPDGDLSMDALWNLVFDEGSAAKGLWKEMAILTLDRPRDIIKLLKQCQERNDIGCLNETILNDTKADFSNWMYSELRDEIQSFLPNCWQGTLNCLTEMSTGIGKISDLEKVLNGNYVISTWLKENKKEAIYLIELLFSYSVIGCVDDKGRWIFSYKDPSLCFMRSYKNYCVHYGFCKKLRIQKPYEESAKTKMLEG